MVSRKEFLQLSFKGACLIGLGNTLESFSDHPFWRPPPNEIKLRFALASDGHYGQPETEYQANHYKMVDWLNTEKKMRGLDFAMINGDLFHDRVVFLPEVKTKWDFLEMPYYVSHGNHDITTVANWEEVWKMPIQQSFEYGESAFIILNTASETGVYICPDPNWTKTELEKYESKKHLFVFMHITPIKWTGGGIDCPEIVDLFSGQSNLRGIFHGHDHQEDSVKKHGSKHYFFDSHMGGNWGTDYHGYRIVEVLKNDKVFTYQMNAAAQYEVNRNKIT